MQTFEYFYHTEFEMCVTFLFYVITLNRLQNQSTFYINIKLDININGCHRKPTKRQVVINVTCTKHTSYKHSM